MKKAIGVLIGILLNLQVALGSMDILHILILSIHKYGVYFHLFVPSSVSFFNDYNFKTNLS